MKKKIFISTENFEILKSRDSANFIIAGYASTSTIDREGDIISSAALRDAFTRFMSNALFRNIQLRHSNTQVGIVLDDYRDGNNKLWKSKIDDKGLFIVVSLRDDIKRAKMARNQIKKRQLRSFSIGGEPLQSEHLLKDGLLVREIQKMDLHEITLCEVPVNPDAEFELLKSQSRWKRIVQKGKDGRFRLKSREIIKQKILKAKIYLKPNEKPPKGHEAKRGPKGGLYYMTEMAVSPIKRISKPKKDDLMLKIKSTNPKVRRKVVRKLKQDQLHLLTHDPDSTVREEVVNYCSQKDLHNIIEEDNNHDVLWEVATRVDDIGLHKLVDKYKPNGIVDENTIEVVAGRINQKGLHRLLNMEIPYTLSAILERIDKKGLERILEKHRDDDYGKDASIRLNAITQISKVAKNFKKTGKIEFNKEITKTIKKIVKMNIESSDMINMTDEFYTQIGFGDFHQNSKSAWESSANAPLAIILKDSIRRRFGGAVRSFKEVADPLGDPDILVEDGRSVDEMIEREYLHLNVNKIDEYTKIHKEFTRKILDIAYPNQDKIKLYRGTTTHEGVVNGDDIMLQSNPLSSWTTKKEVAKDFADMANGIMIEADVSKDNIWSTFMSHALEGGVREFLIITPDTRKGKIIYTQESTMKSDKKTSIILNIDNNIENIDWLHSIREKYDKLQIRTKMANLNLK